MQPWTRLGGGLLVKNTNKEGGSLVETKDSLEASLKGLDEGLTNDLLAEGIRQALHHLGEITTEDLLENIFRKFCIGK